MDHNAVGQHVDGDGAVASQPAMVEVSSTTSIFDLQNTLSVASLSGRSEHE